jgi:hypothetical protein
VYVVLDKQKKQINMENFDLKKFLSEGKLLTENESITITKIEKGRDTDMTFGAIGAGYTITLSNNKIVDSDDEDLLDRYSELRQDGRKNLDQLNKILVGKPWDMEY